MGHNPALGSMRRASGQEVMGEGATYRGVALKTIYFASVALLSAVVVLIALYWALRPVFEAVSGGYSPDPSDVNRAMGLLAAVLVGGMVVGFIGMLGTFFARRLIPVFGTIYTIGQGAVMGVMSGFAELYVPGVVFAALLATFTVFAVMSVLFFTGIIQVGHRFRSVMRMVLISVLVFSLLYMLMIFIVPSLFVMFTNNPLWPLLSIGISVVMIVVASLMLLFDLSLIKEAVDNGLDKHYEWFGAFGLVVTLMWLYIEFLRLFLKLAALVGRRR